MYRCKYFKLHELVDPATYRKFGEWAWVFFDDDTLRMVDGLRDYFNVPLTINNWHWGGQLQWSGLRTLDCTEGAQYSMHRFGKAFDIKAKLSATEMRREIMAHKDHPFLKYINRMEDGVSWLHVDRANVEERIVLFNP